MRQIGTFEDFHRSVKVRASSDRSFCVVFAIFFAVLGLSPLRHGKPVHAWAFILSALFLAGAILRPSLFHPLSILWLKLGAVLGRITNPIMIGLMFYAI